MLHRRHRRGHVCYPFIAALGEHVRHPLDPIDRRDGIVLIDSGADCMGRFVGIELTGQQFTIDDRAGRAHKQIMAQDA